MAPGQAVQALVQRGVPLHIAQGVVMNFMDESGLESGIQELAPNSGRGGYGLAQWTGPRRVALEDFARAQGKPINDPELQLDFFMQENAGVEAPAWKQVMSAPTAQDAAVAFVNKWERPASNYAEQRSAKYAGYDLSKLADMQLRAGHPGATTVGTGGYVAPGADTTQVPTADAVGAAAPAQKEGDQDKYQSAASGAFDALADMKAPTMGRAPQMPVQAPIPTGNVPLLAGPAAGGNRDQLAMLMMQLNSGKLWG
jgi:hypothetical protein